MSEPTQPSRAELEAQRDKLRQTLAGLDGLDLLAVAEEVLGPGFKGMVMTAQEADAHPIYDGRRTDHPQRWPTSLAYAGPYVTLLLPSEHDLHQLLLRVCREIRCFWLLTNPRIFDIICVQLGS